MNISIALCTYNGERFLQDQLESIAAQTRLPDELVICDDRSSDNTIRIIERFACRAPFPVRLLINDKNLGSTKNFERAIDNCDGHVIALSDQDDVWHARKLERMERIFVSSQNVGLVFADGEVVDDRLNPLGYRLWEGIGFTRAQQKRMKKGKAFDVLLINNVVTGANMAFLSRFRELILPIPTKFPLIHDGWIALVIAAVADLASLNEPLTQYRQHSTQQIGAARIGLKQRLARARQAEQSAYLNEAEQFRRIYERLSANSDKLLHEEALVYLRAKIAHLQVRASLPKHRVNRVPHVLREMVNLRYHHFSKGMYSFAKDLLF